MSDILEGVDTYSRPSFSLKNRLKRLVWGIVYAVFYRPTPRPMNGWRVFLLRFFGAKIGAGSTVKSSIRVWAPWNLEMGDYSALGEGVNVYSMAKITIGNKVTVSQGSHLCAGTHDYTSKNFQLYAEPITIGNDAWVCTECFVGPGVTIGEGAVIGARGVATKDMPAWTVCAGNPCKPIKPRVMRDE
ncbi:MAG: colanic acid biosynthesis acetyltransferase WcaF [Chthonomonadaceae bacterium]|nr:colanic acid biosynthesis acetyltransferase WcaF [Chthonomonadaceae bacterium]